MSPLQLNSEFSSALYEPTSLGRHRYDSPQLSRTQEVIFLSPEHDLPGQTLLRE